MDEAAAIELAEDAHDAAGAVNVFHVHIGLVGRDLAETGDAAREAVDVGHREGDAGFLGCGEEVEHGVG